MNVWMAHYLPPVSFGGCEDLTITLAKKYGGMLYCPRRSDAGRPGFLSGTPTYKGIYRRRGISGDTVVFQENIKRLAGKKIDTLFIMGLYWPEIVQKGLNSLGPVRRVVLVPQYHIHDGVRRLRDLHNKGISQRVDRVVAYTATEASYVMTHAAITASAKVTLCPHLAGICVDNEGDLPRCDDFGKTKKDQGALYKGYVLFPSRPSKGLPRAQNIARRLNLPLVGNMSYGVSGGVDGCIDFDRFNPYKGARLMVSVTKNDSYNIGIAKSMAFKVPALWANTNEQIRPIWSEFPSAIPLGNFKGQVSLDHAAKKADECQVLIRKRIKQSLERFEAIL